MRFGHKSREDVCGMGSEYSIEDNVLKALAGRPGSL